MEGILIPLSFFAMVFGIVYVTVVSRHKEKMNMMEKGILPAEMEKGKKESQIVESRKGGLVVLGVGIGLIIGAYIQSLDTFLQDGIAIGASICVFVGIALIVNYVLQQKDLQNSEK